MAMFSSRRARAARPSPVRARVRRSLFESLEARVVLAAPEAIIQITSAEPYVSGLNDSEDVDFVAGPVEALNTYDWKIFADADNPDEFTPGVDDVLPAVEANSDPSDPNFTFHSTVPGVFWATLVVTNSASESSELVYRRIDIAPEDPGSLLAVSIEPAEGQVIGAPITAKALGQPLNFGAPLQYYWEVFLDDPTADSIGAPFPNSCTEFNRCLEAFDGISQDADHPDPVDDLPEAGDFSFDTQIEFTTGTDQTEFTFTPSTAGTYFVRVTTFENGQYLNSSEFIPIGIVPADTAVPTIDSLIGPATAVQGQPVTYTATVSDANVEDVLTSTWLLLDDSDSVIESGSGLAFSTGALNIGNYTVRFTVDDGDGGTATQDLLLSVVGSALSGAGVLTVGGASGGSNVNVNPSGDGLSVSVDGQTQTYASGEVTQIVVYGQSGSDVVIVASSITTPAWIFGGGGTDILRGGGGADVLSGGSGGDVLIGGGGRDLVIGGTGTDILIGDAADDILIAGHTDQEANLAALAAIMAIWTNGDAFSDRTDALRCSLLVSEGDDINVFDDDAMDVLVGNSGLDWYFANLVRDGEPATNRDIVAGATAAELAEYEELING